MSLLEVYPPAMSSLTSSSELAESSTSSCTSSTGEKRCSYICPIRCQYHWLVQGIRCGCGQHCSMILDHPENYHYCLKHMEDLGLDNPSVSGPAPATRPSPSTATQLWLGKETHDGTSLCDAVVIADSTASFPGAAKTPVGTAEPAEFAISIRATDPSLRQELEKFKDLLRRGKSQGFLKRLLYLFRIYIYMYFISSY